MRIAMSAALFLLAGSAQAFTVTVNSVERMLSANSSSGGFYVGDQATYSGTGTWADAVSYEDEVSAAFADSNVPDSGAFNLYELTMAGSLSTSSSEPASAYAGIALNVTFDEAVNLTLACPVGARYTQVQLETQPSAFTNLYCGNSLTLAAGTHDLTMASSIGTFGGSVFLDFDATLSITAVPIPAAAWLFASALAGLGWLRRRQTV
jgi:hypothetical protein